MTNGKVTFHCFRCNYRIEAGTSTPEVRMVLHEASSHECDRPRGPRGIERQRGPRGVERT